MSRVGKKPLPIPSGAEVRVEGGTLKVKGPKGELAMQLPRRTMIAVADGVATVTVKDEENVNDRALWGLIRRLLENMVTGVTKGFEKQLEINGVGFKANMQGANLKLDVGFSHDVTFEPPTGITLSVEKNVITVKGIDKQMVGEAAARIRKIKKPEPYKGKGIKYVGETIRHKAGKAAKAGSAA